MKYEKIQHQETENHDKHEEISQKLGADCIVYYETHENIEEATYEEDEEIMGRYYDGEEYLIAVKDSMYEITGEYSVYKAKHAKDAEEQIELKKTTNQEEIDTEEIAGFVQDNKAQLKGKEIKPGVAFAGAGEKAIKLEIGSHAEFIKYENLHQYPELVEFIQSQMPQEEETPAIDTTEIKSILKKAGRGYQTSQGTIDEILPSAVSIGGYRYGYSDEKTQQIVEEIKGGI